MIESAKYTIRQLAGQARGRRRPHVLGQVYFYNGEIDKALEQFDAVNPHSERYPMARHLAGYIYCQLYLREKEKPKATRNEAAMTADREQAMKALNTSVQLQEEKWVKADADARAAHRSEIAPGQIATWKPAMAKAAAAEFQPLIDEVDKSKPKSLETRCSRIFLGGVRAYVATNDLEKAERRRHGAGRPRPRHEDVNEALLRFARLLEKKRKEGGGRRDRRGRSRRSHGSQGPPGGHERNAGQIADEAGLARNVSPMRHGVDRRDQLRRRPGPSGRNAVPAVSETIQENPAFRRIGRPQGPHAIRTLLVHILGKTGQFQAALEQVTKLITEHPTALEPRVEECRLRHAWAMKDPNRFSAPKACRGPPNSLDRITGKKPSEYYEVVYYRGRLLLHAGRHARQEGNKVEAAEAAKKAAQILKSPCSTSLTSMVRTGSRSTATCSANSTGCKVGLRPAKA